MCPEPSLGQSFTPLPYIRRHEQPEPHHAALLRAAENAYIPFYLASSGELHTTSTRKRDILNHSWGLGFIGSGAWGCRFLGCEPRHPKHSKALELTD